MTPSQVSAPPPASPSSHRRLPQVRELQRLLRTRGAKPPPALSSSAADAARTPACGGSSAQLELKVQRLEAELENRNQEAKRSFQTMEQHFQTVKVGAEEPAAPLKRTPRGPTGVWALWQARYEQHVCELQQRLEAADGAAGLDGRQAFEGELQRLRAGHQERERALQQAVEALQQQLKHKVGRGIAWSSALRHPRELTARLQAHASPGPRQQQAEAAFGVRIERLNKELSAKSRTIQKLSRSVERLRKDKRSPPPASSRQPQGDDQRTETRQPPAAEETFPAAGCQKTYRPTVFTGRSAEGFCPPLLHPPSSRSAPLPDSHISDVLQENEALKRRLELLELHAEQEKEALKAEVAQAREQLLR